MTFILEFYPIPLFFWAYHAYDFKTATATLLTATIINLALFKIITGHITRAQWLTSAIITASSALTLSLDNTVFLLWKPTVIFWALGAYILFTRVDTIIEKFKGTFEASLHEWKTAKHIWAIYFILLGVMNINMAYTLTEAEWVNFKTFVLPFTPIPLIILTFTLIGIRLSSEKDKISE